MKNSDLGQISGDGGRTHLSGDDGMDGGPAVSHHEDELALWKQLGEVVGRLERERVLVAETRRRLAVSSYHLQTERRDR